MSVIHRARTTQRSTGKPWTVAEVEAFKRHRAAGLSIRQCCKFFPGRSENALLGLAKRVREGWMPGESGYYKLPPEERKPHVSNAGWSEAVLTEPWTEYHARKAAERAERRRMAAQQDEQSA